MSGYDVVLRKSEYSVGYDEILILPYGGDEKYSVGHLLLQRAEKLRENY
jgi:hypothetical protein